MPYNPGTGIYTLPAVYLAIPGTTILATQHNTPLEDLEVANNYARPIIAGGTGSISAATARGSVTGIATEGNIGAKGSNLASAAALTLLDNFNYFHVTGTTGITSISTRTSGQQVTLEFEGILTITHSAGLFLSPPVNRTTAAGDIAIFVSEGAGNWRCASYQVAATAVGNVVGPVSATDNAIARFDLATGKAIQNSAVTITDAGNIVTSNGSSAVPAIGINSGSTGFYQSASNEIGVTVNGTVKGAWTASGFNVGLGTALIDPDGPTSGCSMSAAGAWANYFTSGAGMQVGSNQASFTAMNFKRATVSVGTIVCSAGATAYNTSSDYRIKELVVTFDIDTAGDIIDRIRPVTYLLKEEFGGDGHTVFTGFIAHELQEVYPAAVTGKKDAVDEDGNIVIQGVDPSKLVALLVAEMQASRKRERGLMQTVNDLASHLLELEKRLG